METTLYVQYGCGWSAPAGWINFDSSPTLRFERLPVIGRLHLKNAARFPENVRFGDIVRGLPVLDQACDGVYASHVLEHLARDEFELALKETFRILKPNGRFRVIVPDLETAARKYVKDLDDGVTNASDRFVWDYTMLGQKARPRSMRQAAYFLLNNSRHLWMWDYLTFSERLRCHGFGQIRRATFNDSADLAFRAVENEKRFQNAVAIEAVRVV